MTNQDLKTNEFEHDIQRFMQIRDQIHSEVKKIGAHASTLDETNKRLVAHFDVFKEIADDSEEQISSAIKEAAQEMAKESIRSLAPLLESLLEEQILSLKRSIATAESCLSSAIEEKNTRPFFYSFLLWSLLFTVGFGVRGLIPPSTGILPEQLLQKIEHLDHKVTKCLLLQDKSQGKAGVKRSKLR